MSDPVRRPRAAWVAGALALALSLVAPPPSALHARAQLQGVASVQVIYDRILDADFEGAHAAIRACDGPPREACDVLDATRLWWQILFDLENPALDAEFLRSAEKAIASTEAWTEREPRSAAAWFFLGGAYGARVQFRAYRKEYLGAARDGKHVKEALERALAIDASLVDANFGIGLYEYYADIAPATAKFLRVLLLLPGGDRAEGLTRMWQARDHGQVMASEATFQLHVIDLWYEKQFTRAVELLRELERDHPRNPYFPQLIAEVMDVYFHDRTASLEGWRHLLDRASRRAVNEAPVAAVRARLGAAQQLDALFETDAAIELLQPLAGTRPAAPFGAASRTWLQLGQALDRIGERDRAVKAYAAAIAAAPAGDPQDVRARARRGQREAPDATRARAYRLSLDGWRALERREIGRAERALDESLRLHDDPVARYRRARASLARHDERAAQLDLERVLASPPADAPTIYAHACLDAAAIHERRGEQALALNLYDRAATIFGAAEATKRAGAKAAARVRTSAR